MQWNVIIFNRKVLNVNIIGFFSSYSAVSNRNDFTNRCQRQSEALLGVSTDFHSLRQPLNHGLYCACSTNDWNIASTWLPYNGLDPSKYCSICEIAITY